MMFDLTKLYDYAAKTRIAKRLRDIWPRQSYLIKRFMEIESIDMDFRGEESRRELESRYLNVLREIKEKGIALDPKAAEQRHGRSEALLVDRKIGFYGLNYYLHIGGGFNPDNEKEVQHFTRIAKEPESKQAYRDWFKSHDMPPPSLG